MEKNLKEKIDKIFKKAKGVDLIVLVNTEAKDPNFNYVTQLLGVFESSVLILKRKGARLITSVLDVGKAKKVNGMEIITFESRKVREELKKEIKKKNLGINEQFITYGTAQRIKKRYKPKKLVGVSEAFASARIIKDQYEITQIKKAVKVTKKAMARIQKNFRVGVTEKQLAKEFDRLSIDLGGDELSFPTIMSFGENSAVAHHMPGNTKLRYGDLIMIDAGVKINNYCSDISRTFIFGSDRPKITDYEKKADMIRVTKEAQKKAISMIKPNAKGSKVHDAIHDHIKSVENGKYKENAFPYALGHSVGIEVHDGLGLWPSSKLVFKPGMVIAVEPGIEVSGLGGVRFEDEVLVTKKGAIIL